MRRFLFLLILLILAPALAVAEEASFPIAAINPQPPYEFPGGRGENELVIYVGYPGRPGDEDPARHGYGSTGTNPYGIEAWVQHGMVQKLRSNDSGVYGGYVISGHGEAADWMEKNLRPGTAVRFDAERLYVVDNEMARTRNRQWRLRNLWDQALRAQGEAFDAFEGKLPKVHEREKAAAFTEEQVAALESEFQDLLWAAMPSPEGEIRGVWHRLTETTEEEIAALAQELHDAGVNVLFPEVIYGSQSIHGDPTGLYPQFPRFDGIDPLAILIRECHARGIEVHAWVHCFFVGIEGNENEPPLIAEKHPDWLAETRAGARVAQEEAGYVWISPFVPEAREALIASFVALAENYDLDGFQLDYIRFSRAEDPANSFDFSAAALAKAQEELGFNPREIEPRGMEWGRWNELRQQTITHFVRQAAEALRAVDPELVISADVYPNAEDAAITMAQHWHRWSQEDLLDLVVPMAYFKDPDEIRRVTVHARQRSEGIPFAMGLGPYLELRWETLQEQILESRQYGAEGQILFSWDTTTPAMKQMLRKGPWRERTAPRAENP